MNRCGACKERGVPLVGWRVVEREPAYPWTWFLLDLDPDELPSSRHATRLCGVCLANQVRALKRGVATREGTRVHVAAGRGIVVGPGVLLWIERREARRRARATPATPTRRPPR